MDLRSRRFEDWTRFTHNNIHAVEQDGALLWIGTFSRGLDCLDTASGKVRHWRAEAGNEASLPDDHVFCLCKTSRGDLYIGTLHGACVMQAGSGTIERLDPIRRWFVISIAEDGEGGDEGAEDAELGSYKMSSSGVKLYYDDTEFSDELMLTLEKYFLSFPAADYNSYQKCMFPSYIDEMEGFLGKEYDYDLKTSFSKRCSSLADNMYGDYKITRIKLEAAPVYDETKDNLETYFESLNEVFGKDYYEQVKSESDEVIDACFYIMGEDAYGQENPIVTGYEIVFAVKDGKYYTFG